MEAQLIYAKTAAGEKALRQLRPPLQRELRAVLDAVDGAANAGELKRRFGDGVSIDAALEELERQGLIRKHVARPQLWEVVLGDLSVDEPPPLAGSAHSDPSPRVSGTADRGGLPALLCRKWSAWRGKWAARKEERAFRRAYETPGDDDRFAPVELKPIRRGRRRKRVWPRLVFAVLLLLVVVTPLLALFFPYQRYRPEIERRLSAALHDPVRVNEVHFSFQPYPNITLAGVTVGAESYAEIKAIRVLPDPFSLFGSNWIVTHARIEGLHIRDRGIGPSAHWLSGAAGKEGAILLRGANFDQLSVDLGDLRLGGLSGELSTTSEGGVVKILLHNDEGNLHLEAVPAAGGYLLSVLGNALPLPLRSPLLPEPIFAHLEVQGEIRSGLLRLSQIDGRLYDGFLDGTAELGWTQAASLVADLRLRGVSSAKLLAAPAPRLSLVGEISGRFHIESHAAELAGLADNLRVNGAFLVERGAINGLDLIEAVRSQHPTRGGATRFERFTGELRLDGQACRLGRLKLSSGLMRAEGHLDIASDRRIGGLMAIDLTGAATRIHASVAIGGTLGEPQIAIGRGARITP